MVLLRHSDTLKHLAKILNLFQPHESKFTLDLAFFRRVGHSLLVFSARHHGVQASFIAVVHEHYMVDNKRV